MTLMKSSYPIGWRSYYYIDSIDLEKEFIESTKKKKWDLYGLDIETSPLPEYASHSSGGLSPHLSKIATIQVSLPTVGEALFHVNKYGFTDNLKSFLDKGTPVAHNAIFEYQHFKHAGLEFDEIHDSMLLYRLFIHSRVANYKATKASLEALIDSIRDHYIEKQSQKSDWGALELTEEQKAYAVRDAYQTITCFNILLNLIQNAGVSEILNFYKLNRLALPAIGDMVYHGVRIDSKVHNEMIEEWEKELADSEEELYEILPKEVNINSPKQLADWIKAQITEQEFNAWPKSEKTGNLVCDADTLSDHDHIEAIAPLLKVKKLSKSIGTYGPNLRTFVNPVTSRAHPQYTQCNTGSGRLSSFSFNIQNNPRGDFRKIFIPNEGNVLVGADYGMIEVRVYAHHSNDSTMLEGFERGLDMYKIVAALIAGKKLAEVTKEERQKAKAVLLGRLFLLGPNTLIKYAKNTFGVSMTLQEAKDLIGRVDDTFYDGAIWQKNQVEKAKEELKVVSKFGKIRILEEDNYYNKSVNHPIQSDACAVMLMAMNKVRRSLKDNNVTGAFLYCCVHDELIIETPEKHVEIVKKILKDNMEEAMLTAFPTATTLNLVDLKSGHNWLELK